VTRTTTSCAREAEVLLAAAAGWSRADAALAAHAAECPRCVEMMAGAEAVRESCARDLAAARVPSSAVVWWRLERRLREDRARAARRTLTVAHAISGAVAAGAVLAAAEAISPVVRPSLAAGWRALASRPEWIVLSPGWTLPLGLMALALAVLAPTVLYLGIGRD
jgi:hypothetical protein